jgi:hypothetical protein
MDDSITEISKLLTTLSSLKNPLKPKIFFAVADGANKIEIIRERSGLDSTDVNHHMLELKREFLVHTND